MNRIVPCQTENKAQATAGLVAIVIDFDCNFVRAGTAGAGPSKGRILSLVRRAGWRAARK